LRNFIVLERNGRREVTELYVRGVGGRLLRSHNHLWFLYNNRGDVVQRVDNAGQVLHTYRFGAFGVELNPDPSNSNRFRFNGMYFDLHRSEYMTAHRMYSPRLGRWNSPDPFFHALHGNLQSCVTQAGNLYMFVTHNPVKWVDPLGLYRVMLDYIAWQEQASGFNFSFGLRSDGYAHIRFRGDSFFAPFEMIMGMATIRSSWLMEVLGFSENRATHRPGDQFRTAAHAALAFALTFNMISFERSDRHPNGREHSANIYRTSSRWMWDSRAGGLSTGYWHTFQQIQIGTSYTVSLANPRARYGTHVAQVHTHGAYSRMVPSENFTDSDRAAGMDARVNIFLATPGGRLVFAEFNHSTNLFSDSVILTRDLPFDTYENYNRWHGR